MRLPFTAALVPGLADLFLMPLSATGSSSTSFSARELRLLGPLGFSTAALGGPDRKTTTKKEGQHKDVTKKVQGCVLTLLYSEKDIIPLGTLLFFLVYHRCCPSSSRQHPLRRHDHCLCLCSANMFKYIPWD